MWPSTGEPLALDRASQLHLSHCTDLHHRCHVANQYCARGAALPQDMQMALVVGRNRAYRSLLGTGLWDTEALSSEPALVGGWFAAPPNNERQSFIKNYQEMFGRFPPRLATLAYDATALAAIFVKPDGRFDPAEILVPEGFGGRDGIFRFSSQGHTNRGLSIYQVEERGVKVIEKAPSSFKNLTN